MNKLISRNPVLRFKEGLKILKFQNAGVISYKGRDGIDYEAWRGEGNWYYRKKGTLNILNMPKNYVTTSGIRFYDANGNIIKNPSSNLNNSSNNTPESLDYRKALESNYYSQLGKGRSYTENGNNYWLGSDGSKTFISGKVTGEDGKEYWKGSDGSMTLLNPNKPIKKDSKTSPSANAFNKALLGSYMFGKMGGWNRSMGNTITDQESLNYLKEMGLDGLNALQIQQYINQQLGKNSVKEDNKWGNLSRAGLKALYENWKLQQKPQTQSPIGNSVIEFLRSLEEIPQLSQDLLMFNNINSKTFNAPLPPRTIPYDRSMTRDIIKDITGNSAYNFTGDLRKALRQYLNGEQYDQEAIKAFGDLKQYDKYMKWRLLKGGILPSRNIVERFKQGRKIEIFQDGGVKRYSVSHTDKKKTVYFDTEEQAKAYLKKQKAGTTVRRDSKKEASGQVLKVDRTKEKATQYGRQQLEKNNKLSFKQAYQAARKSGNKYFAYKGKVYKSDLENGKDNMDEMAQHYGNNLGYSGDPKLGTKKSMAARALYRKDINTSEVGYTGEKKKFQAPYVSSYDGGELFSNFMGLASPTRWAGAVGRASRGEGNTGTFVGKVLNNMLDPQNGARENQGIFSSGLAPTDEQWAAEHPVISGVVNGALDAAIYGPKPKFNRDFKFKTNWGYNGRQFKTVKEEVPMGIFEGDLNISPGVSTGSNPYIQLGKQVGETTKTVTRRVMTNPGTKYVKSVTEKPTGKYNFSWSEGMKDMFPWVTANTFNRTMQL